MHSKTHALLSQEGGSDILTTTGETIQFTLQQLKFVCGYPGQQENQFVQVLSEASHYHRSPTSQHYFSLFLRHTLANQARNFSGQHLSTLLRDVFPGTYG